MNRNRVFGLQAVCIGGVLSIVKAIVECLDEEDSDRLAFGRLLKQQAVVSV